MNLARIHEEAGSISDLAQCIKGSSIALSYGVGHSDLSLLCLWRRPTATALVQPLAWELTCAEGVALKRQKIYIYICIYIYIYIYEEMRHFS